MHEKYCVYAHSINRLLLSYMNPQEATKINFSLSALGNVISALVVSIQLTPC